MGLGQTYLWELKKLCYAAWFGFYSLGSYWRHVPEWLEEELQLTIKIKPGLGWTNHQLH
jgi:hypothetical protein